MPNKTIQLSIVVDDNGGVQKVVQLDQATDSIIKKAPAVKQAAGDMGGGFGALGKAIGDMAEQVGVALPFQFGIAAAAGEATGTQLIEVFKSLATFVTRNISEIAEWSHQITNLSQQTGIALGPLQSLGTFAKSVGVSSEELALSIGRLAQRLNDPSGGGGAQQAIESMGLSLTKLRALNPDEMFIQVAQSVGQFTNQQEKALVATELLGRSGAQMGAALTKDIRDRIDEQNRYNTSTAPETIARYKEYEEKTVTLAAQWQTFKTDVLLPFLPLLDDMVTRAQKFVDVVSRVQSKDGQNIPGMGGGGPKLPIGSPGAQPLAGPLQIDLSHLGAIGSGVPTETLTALDRFNFSVAALKDHLVELDPVDQQWVGTLRDAGVATSQISLLLREKTGNQMIDTSTIENFIKVQANAKLADTAWGEGAKAAAMAASEGYSQALAVAEADHLTRLKLIADEVISEQNKNLLLQNEATRNSAAMLSIRTEESRKIRDLQENAAAATRIEMSTHYGDAAAQQRAALQIEENQQIASASREYSSIERQLEAIGAIVATAAAKRNKIEQDASNYRMTLIANELAATVKNQAAQGFNMNGEDQNDPYLMAARKRSDALHALDVQDAASAAIGISSFQQRNAVESEYVATLNATDAAQIKARQSAADLTTGAGRLASAIGMVGANFFATNQQAEQFYSMIAAHGSAGMPGADNVGRPQAVANVGTAAAWAATVPRFEGGGPTRAGLGMLHDNEYVVPKDGALIKNGSPPVTVQVDARGAILTSDRSFDQLADKIAQRFGQRASQGGRY